MKVRDRICEDGCSGAMNQVQFQQSSLLICQNSSRVLLLHQSEFGFDFCNLLLYRLVEWHFSPNSYK